jgi:hypothetical protein
MAMVIYIVGHDEDDSARVFGSPVDRQRLPATTNSQSIQSDCESSSHQP